MQKVGMTREGTLREHVIKWGRHEDVDLYGMISTVEKTSRP
jgi:ribosomal-protein-alanine N-acetyltransferase